MDTARMTYTVDLERRVQLVTTKRSTSYVPFDPPAYRLGTAVKGGRIRAWLVAKAWKLLERFGALSEAQQFTEKYETASFVPKDVIDAVMRQYHELRRDDLSDRQPTIVMGPEDFYELAGIVARDTMGYTSFNITSDRREFRGMEIKVLPWMRGVVVVP